MVPQSPVFVSLCMPVFCIDTPGWISVCSLSILVQFISDSVMWQSSLSQHALQSALLDAKLSFCLFTGLSTDF